jgi:predicted aspartyl protease
VRALPPDMAPPTPPGAFPGRVPAVAGSLGQQPLTVLVDTGFQGLLAVPREFAVEWRTPPRHGGELATLDGVSDHDTGRAAGAFVVAEQRFEEPWVMVADGAPKIGMGALRRSVLTLDAGSGRVWITPSAVPAPLRRGR